MKIGVWNTAFLGDTLLTLPLLRALQKKFPDAKIDFWVRKSYVSLYEEQEGYTTYGYMKKRDGSLSGLYDLGRKIREKKYDVWINPHPSLRSSYIMWASHACTRISYTYPYINRFLSTASFVRERTQHEVFRLLALGKDLGISREYTLPCYSVPTNVQEETFLYRAEQGLQGVSVIALAIGALWKTKQWLPEYFADITQKAIRAGHHIVFVGGGKEERHLLHRILDYAGYTEEHHNIHNFLDASLEQTAGILSTVDICCGNDTGLMHLAWIQNIPTIALFGATAKEQGFYPLSEGSISLGTDISCRPCGNHGASSCPKKHFRCMKELSPELVWNHIQNKMRYI